MNRYNVQMVIGNDTATSVTTVEATDSDTAILSAQMMFRDTTVRVLDVTNASPDFCEFHPDQELEIHCTSCTSMYCEACEYDL